MQPIISVRNLSKRYKLGLSHAGSVRELVNRSVSRLAGRKRGSRANGNAAPEESSDHVWALRDVNFDVQPGEVLGIIGANGAGKSTLLKILSRITRPTEGEVEMRGRVASLLEVGTGFHPELTGRENIYMNGTVLGMTRREIKRQFDSIVDFAGVETFIDTPVKRYSSGMTVRLGFAVAAHMSPEILIIDEVLAVGDAEFQRRCIGKMDEVAKSGRTVLFVSHNMMSIRQLAKRSIVLEKGQKVLDGETDAALDRYLAVVPRARLTAENMVEAKRLEGWGDRSVEFLSVGSQNLSDSAIEKVLAIETRVFARHNARNAVIGVTIYQSDGTPVGSAFGPELPLIQQGEELQISFAIEIHQLTPGRYWTRLGLMNERNQVTDVLDRVLDFEIKGGTNVPSQFVQWNRGWGSFRFQVTSMNVSHSASTQPLSPGFARSLT